MALEVRLVRQAQGVSIGELSRRAGLSRMTVQAADRDESVALETLVKIARALGVSLSDIAPDAAKTLEGIV